MRRHLY